MTRPPGCLGSSNSERNSHDKDHGPPSVLCCVCRRRASTTPADAQVAVFDPSVFARQFEQLTEMKKQVETLTSQLKVAQDQLGQAKQLYESFNKLTNVNDIASLLNSSEFRKYLPSEFSQIEGLIKGTGSGSFSSAIDSYLRNNRYYTQNAGNSFYASELERIARQTGAKQSIGQAVYDTASKRIDELEKLRQQISASKDVKDVLDLSARFQAEQALLQNDVCACRASPWFSGRSRHGCASVSANVRRQLIDEMKALCNETVRTFLLVLFGSPPARIEPATSQIAERCARPFQPARWFQPRPRRWPTSWRNPGSHDAVGAGAGTTRAGLGTRPTASNAGQAQKHLMCLVCGSRMRPQACKGGFLTMAVAVFDDFLKEFEQPITQFVSNLGPEPRDVRSIHRCERRRRYVSSFMASPSYAARSASRSWASRGAPFASSSSSPSPRTPRPSRLTWRMLFFESLPKEVGNAIAGSGLDTSIRRLPSISF